MKKWILKRKNGQVVSICDTRPEGNEALLVQEISVTDEELESAFQSVGLREENGKLVSTDLDHLPMEIRPLIEKVKNKDVLNAQEKDELLMVLFQKLL